MKKVSFNFLYEKCENVEHRYLKYKKVNEMDEEGYKKFLKHCVKIIRDRTNLIEINVFVIYRFIN